MKISASLFSRKSNWNEYSLELANLGVDYIHIDYLDGLEEPVKIEELKNLTTKIPFDVHLITSVLRFDKIEQLNQSNTSHLCVQYENLIDKNDLLLINQFNGFKGLAVTIETPIIDVCDILNDFDFIMIMCSIPGVSGAKFNNSNFKKITEIRQLYPNLDIHVDGGIEQEKFKIMENLGVKLCVCGSFLAAVEGQDLVERFLNLKAHNPDKAVSDLMVLGKYLTPISETANFIELLENIDNSSMGIAFVVDHVGDFIGVVTNGDICRLLIKDRSKCFDKKVADIVNRKAYFTTKNTQIKSLILQKIALNKASSIIPVVENRKLVGVIDLRQII